MFQLSQVLFVSPADCKVPAFAPYSLDQNILISVLVGQIGASIDHRAIRLERLEKQKRADRGTLHNATVSARSNNVVFAWWAQRGGFTRGQLSLLRLTPLKSKRHHTKITTVSTRFKTRYEEWKFSRCLNRWLTYRCNCGMFHAGVVGPCLDPSFHSFLPFFALEVPQTQCRGRGRAHNEWQQGVLI